MKITYLKIEQSLKIPVYSFGTKKKILLFAGMHGDEDSGPIILKSLVKKFRKNKNAGDITIIPVVNLEAFRANTRTNPRDGIDLNRIFPVKKVKSHSYKIAQTLQRLSEPFEIIIDIHVFTKRQTLLCGIDLNIGNQQIKKKIHKLMNILKLNAICVINHRTEPKKDGSLCGYLQNLNKLAFGIELPPYRLLTKTQISNIITGLVNISKYGLKPRELTLNNASAFIRQQYKAKEQALFIPKNKLGKKINTGDLMGILKTRGKKVRKVYSPYNGTLLSISYKRPVKAAETIFTLGKPVKK